MIRPFAMLICTSIFTLGPAHAGDWPEFRGPGGQGVADVAAAPSRWTATQHVAWKQELPGGGWSSPVLHHGKIYLTAAIPLNDSEDYTLSVLCLDAASGKTLRRVDVFTQQAADDVRIHRKNSHASPTPIIDGGRLFAHFGHQGTACLDLEGNVLWKRRIEYQPVHGPGGSPALTDRALIFSCDGAERQLVVALDRQSGTELWRTERNTDAAKKFSFSTPLVIDAAGRKQVISPGSGAVCSYDPQTGDEIWRVRYDGYSVIPRPVYGHGLIFISTGYDSPKVLAIRPGGEGDVTDSHVAWTLEKGAPNTPSLLLVGGKLYMVSDGGIATCVDAGSGEVHWQKRVGGNYSASPIYADGKIYLQSEQGDGTVLNAGPSFEEIAVNPLGERTLASYAVDDGTLFIRSEQHLFRIGMP